MKWSNFNMRFKLAVIFAGVSFILFFVYLLLSKLGYFLPDFILINLPLKLVKMIFGWQTLESWKAYISGLIFAPIYYAILGFFIGLLFDKKKLFHQ